MRTTMNAIHQNTLFNLNRVLKDMQELNSKVTSGKELSRISDDPIRMVSSLALRTNLAEIEQYQRNMLFGNNLLSAAEEALTQLQGVISDAKQASIQLSSSSADPTLRSNSAALASNFLEQAVSLANSQVAGKYLFGGFKSSGYTAAEHAPFLSDYQDGYSLNSVNRAQVRVGTTPAPIPMAAGAIVINGIPLGAAANDGLSTIYGTSSAAALATAINSSSSLTGVEAVAVPATRQAVAAVAAGSIGTGALVINGQNIFTSVTAISAGDANNTLLNAINEKSALTGVTATRGTDGRLLLATQDGRNISVTTTAAGEAVTRINGFTGQGVSFGSLQLSSDRQFTIQSTIGDDLAVLGLNGGESATGEEGDVAGDNRITADSLVSMGGAVRYAGDRQNSMEIAVGRSSKIEISKNGQELFVDTGLFSTLHKFETILSGERFYKVTGTQQATNTSATLNSGATGLPLDGIVTSGAISFTVTDNAYQPPRNTQMNIPVDITLDTPASIAAKINGIPGITAKWDVNGRLAIASTDPERYSFGFSDSSNFLQASGVTVNQAQTEALQGITAELQTIFDSLTDHVSDLAAKTNRLQVQNDIYESLTVSATENLSEIEDADLAKAVMELKAKEVAYEAALAAAAKTLQMSLLNFL